ncbi:hypothetical protein ACIQU6_31990 [Streptomyces sp. NPDC090442]|uniref:hypothetical protein n=1 Tax=Streptomyces sp. NPDC090442 TaxID=3365962 RepID=UPI0037F44D85
MPRASTGPRTLGLFRAVGPGPATEREGRDGGEPVRWLFKGGGLGTTRHHGGPPARYAAWLAHCTPVPVRPDGFVARRGTAGVDRSLRAG